MLMVATAGLSPRSLRTGTASLQRSWREFLQLHTLFDQEAGFLVSDSVVFAAEVLVLKEVSEVKQVRHQVMSLSCECYLRPLAGLLPACNHVGPAGSSVVHLPDVEHR